ncbi:MAG: chromosome condensation regulator RCC1, partial [Deltaproteobacteria bacterium]|nr:chromosome condensation regulator RCC1 [Deltaproteobacteria bacterium]
LKSDGSLWVWGYNNFGQLGDGTDFSRPVPSMLGLDSDWNTLFAGGYHTVAGKKDGSLWTWGYNNNGQIGDGTRADRHTPVRIDAENGRASSDAINAVDAGRSIKEEGPVGFFNQDTAGSIIHTVKAK